MQKLRVWVESKLKYQHPAAKFKQNPENNAHALPEQKGTRPLLITTKGFAYLALGGNEQQGNVSLENNSNSHFLSAKIIEVEESIGPTGEMVQGMDEAMINNILREVFKLSPQVVVIAFMHSDKNSVHEKILFNILKTSGIKNVFTSHSRKNLG